MTRGSGRAELSSSSVATGPENHRRAPSVRRLLARHRQYLLARLIRPGLLDRYLLSEVLWRLGAALAIITYGAMLERMLRMIELFVNQGIPLRSVGTMLLDLLPYYFGQSLPAAFLVAALLATARLRSEGALDAMLSSGIGIHRLLRPLAALSAVLTAIALVVAGWLQPYGRYAYSWALDRVTHQFWLADALPGEFLSGFGNKMITFRSADQSATVLSGVFVYESESEQTATGQQTTLVTTTSKTGKLLTVRGDLVLRLHDGFQVRRVVSSASVSVAKFETLDMRLALADDLEAFRPPDKAEGDLTFDDLRRRISGAEGAAAATKATAILNARLARAAVLIALPFLALGLGAFWQRAHALGGRLLAGVILYMGYDHMMNFIDEAIARRGSLPEVVIWSVPIAFALFSFWLFWAVAFRLAGDRLPATLGNLAGALHIGPQTRSRPPRY